MQPCLPTDPGPWGGQALGSQQHLSHGWIEQSKCATQRTSISSEAVPIYSHLLIRKSKGHCCQPLAQASMCNGTCVHAYGKHI